MKALDRRGRRRRARARTSAARTPRARRSSRASSRTRPRRRWRIAAGSEPRYAWKPGVSEATYLKVATASDTPSGSDVHFDQCRTLSAPSRSPTSPTSTAAGRTSCRASRAGDRRDQRPQAGHRRLLGRPDDVRVQARVRAGASPTSTGSTASRSSSSPETTTRGTSATSTSRSSSASGTPCCTRAGVAIVAVDSTEPDLDHGQIGRGRYRWIEEQFASEDADLQIFVLHHHLLPVPGTGRERNVVYDAGDAIECLQRAGVHLVLSGHKHVPYAWRLEDLFVVNAGTVSSLRLRGNTRPCYNVVEIAGTTSTSGASTRSTARSGSSSSRSTRSSTRSTRGGSRTRSPRDRERARAHRRRALRAGRARRARGAAVRLRRRASSSAAPRSCAAARTTACRSSATSSAIAEHGRSVVVDLSDEPVLGPSERFALASRVLARGPRRTSAPTSASTRPCSSRSRSRRSRSSAPGSGSARRRSPAHLARLLARDREVVVVAMGRGGPPEPEVVAGRADARAAPRALARAGGHAASDYLETAALAGVPTIGCRRCRRRARGRRAHVSTCGSGIAARRGAAPRPRRLRRQRRSDPARAVDGRVLVVGPGHDATAYLNPYRVLVSRPRPAMGRRPRRRRSAS